MSSVGKISGKFYEGGTNWTLTAASYTGYDPDATNYTATVTAKYSKKAKYKVYKYTVDVDGKSCALSVKVTPNGKATATLTYDTGKKSKGKTVYYKPTCSTVVIPHTSPDYYNQYKQFHGEVDLYFAPSAGNNFPGWGGYEFVQ